MIQLDNHPQVIAYLDSVCAQVRCTEVRAEIRLELAGHIADRSDAGLEAGLSEAEAVTRAVQQAGDPVLVGRQLDQAHRPRTEWSLLGATLLLVLLGIWAMYAVDASSASPMGIGVFPQKLLWSAVGLAAAGAFMFADYRWLQRVAWPLLGVTLLGILWAGTVGQRANGQSQWVSISPLLLTPALAGIFTEWNWQAPRAWLKGLGLFIVPVLALVLGRSLFAVVEYVVVFGVMVTTTRPSGRQMLPLVAAGTLLAGVGLLEVFQRPYLQARFLIWLKLQKDPLGMGYQVVQSLQALRKAGPWGQGLTASLQTLPEIHSDFVFPYLVYTLGWVAGGGICLVVLYFILRLVRVVRHIREPFGTMLVRGALALFVLEFGWNLLMTAGLVPIAGVTLPFISHGGREVFFMAAVGLVLSVFRRKDLTGLLTRIPAVETRGDVEGRRG